MRRIFCAFLALCLLFAQAASADAVKAGDTVTFGSYPQQRDGADSTPVRWAVIAVSGGNALLLSESCLDFLPYNEKNTKVTWQGCTLRAWLNGDFLAAAFTEEERKAIVPSQTETGVTDSVFLLSMEDWKKWDDRISACDHVDMGGYTLDLWRTTAYADAKNTDARFAMLMRTSGRGTTARYYDDAYTPGQQAVQQKGYIRPALWIDLDAAGYDKFYMKETAP